MHVLTAVDLRGEATELGGNLVEVCICFQVSILITSSPASAGLGRYLRGVLSTLGDSVCCLVLLLGLSGPFFSSRHENLPDLESQPLASSFKDWRSPNPLLARGAFPFPRGRPKARV